MSRIERGQIATTTVTLLRQLDARFMVEVPLQEDQCLVLPVVSA